MKITKEIRKNLNEIKKLYGNVSVSWIQYKYKLLFEDAKKVRNAFYSKG